MCRAAGGGCFGVLGASAPVSRSGGWAQARGRQGQLDAADEIHGLGDAGGQILHRPGNDDAVPVDLADPHSGPGPFARLLVLLLKKPVLCQEPQADLVKRHFSAFRPNELWVADIPPQAGGTPSYVRTFSGWVYVAFVTDVFSRRIVGRQTSTSLYTDLALDAFQMAVWQRKRAGADLTGLIHHSDRGVQYRAIRYGAALAEADAVASVGSKADSYDNAMAEALNSLYKGRAHP